MRYLALIGFLALAACGQPAPEAGDGPQPRITGGGVIDYGSYQTVRAEAGDTVASLAQRHGLSPSAIGSYNGLAPTHRMTEGDELVVPPQG
ncbi:MAG: LysM domain-containing protein [Pseudomonadota bacterium]